MLLIVMLGSCGAPPPSGSTTKGSEAGGFPPSPPVPGAGAVSAVVRNFTGETADVTLRFSLFDITVRLTFLQVPANTSATIVGPEVTDLLEVSAIADDGTDLPSASFRYGEDFLDDTEAEYLIGTEEIPAGVPPTLIFLEPADDTEVAVGEALSVAILDEDPDSAATIAFYLEPFAEAPTQGGEPIAFTFMLDGDETVLATDLAEDADGTSDRFEFELPDDISPGTYRVVAVISDELSTSIVQAPGLVKITDLPADVPEP